MSKKKEAKTNAMRLLDALHIPYRHYSYECREFWMRGIRRKH